MSLKNNIYKFRFAILILVALIVIGGAVYWSVESKNANDPKAQAAALRKQEDDIIAKVSKLILLPTDDRPQIIVIKQIDKLKQLQPFFKDASNGDDVLVFKDKAIIYSPTQDLIINVGPVTRSYPSASSTKAQVSVPGKTATTSKATTTGTGSTSSQAKQVKK